MRNCGKMLAAVVAVMLTGCASESMIYKNRPDIKHRISVSPAVVFDIRKLRDVYGPPRVDSNGDALIYSQVYNCTQFSFLLVWCGWSRWSEAWYLVLRPTKDDHYYTGSRYMTSKYAQEYFDPIYQHEDWKFIDPDIWRTARDIEKHCLPR